MHSASILQIANLKVDYEINPLGIDNPRPRLSWNYQLGQNVGNQTAYQILVSTREDMLSSDTGNHWDSGKVTSARSVHILYEGSSLNSRIRYYWKVRVWDDEGHSSLFSTTAWWEMGLLNSEDWVAHWVGEDPIKVDPLLLSGQLPLFRTSFAINKEVEKACMYVCGLGHYELRLNGAKVGVNVLAPGWTDYDKTCLYNAYDITSYLQGGDNRIGIKLGNGMYNVEGGRYAKFTDSFGKPKFIAQLHIIFSDGTEITIGSDASWETVASPITFSCVYGGEDYDARLEQNNWDAAVSSTPSLNDWQHAVRVQAPEGALKFQLSPPLKVMKTFEPASWTQPKPGIYVADLGQNFSGWVKIIVSGSSGTSVKVTPAERLKEGLADQSGSGDPSYWHYTLRGEETEEWTPCFSYYGFRYVQIEGAEPVGLYTELSDSKPKLLYLEGQMIYSDISTIGKFTCSNEMLNRIHELINWAILSNMKSVMTDCPHREKLGWLEELYLMGPSVMYNYDVGRLFAKAMEDIKDTQLEDGLVPNIAPEYLVFDKELSVFRESPEWGSSYIQVPWLLYQTYGDQLVLERHYEPMKRYMEFLGKRSENYILDYGLGDWCDIGPNRPFPNNTPVALTATAIYYYNAVILVKIASLLQLEEDVLHFTSLAAAIKAAFMQKFWKPETMEFSTGSQTANAIPLVMDLVEAQDNESVLNNLIKDIQNNDYHTTAGDIGHRYVLMALALNNRSDIVYTMSQQTEHPSYIFQILAGATSLTEEWDGPVSQSICSSQNHFMLGHIEEWFYRNLAGIQVDFSASHPIVIKPAVVQGLEWVEAHMDTVSGRISVNWTFESDTERLQLDVTIPTNQTGVIYIPNQRGNQVNESETPIEMLEYITCISHENGYTRCLVGSGEYHFTCLLSELEK